MVFLLTKFGHEALGVREGTEGVEKARNERPDLILLDIHMPRMDGFEVARLIRNDPKCGGIPIVAVTALAMVGDREKILTSGITGYISKPIEPETFPAQVRQYLLLTDVVMPEMSGPELARQMGSLRPGIRVIFTSGYTDAAIARQGVLDPAVAFIQKPYRPKVLARKIREVLGSPDLELEHRNVASE